ncbi:MAG TPA: aminotransferase, partial [Bacteroidetes bacterium]|nr:aminotransferase [Bacteroidota bacterium]HEX05563.1 aminotransferase [Bacteroidota bacterium]
MIVYYNGQYIDKDEVRISPDDRGWLFADGIYEVVRVYNGWLFRMQAHVDRLNNSASEIGLRIPRDLDLTDISEKLLKRNDLSGDATVYIQVTRGVAARSHRFPDAGTVPTVYVLATEFKVNPHQFREGFAVLLVPDTRWARCNVKTINLLPNTLASEAAHQAGAQEAVFVRGKLISEGTHTSVIAIRDGVVITSPVDENILPSVTRAILMQLCQEQGIPVHAEGLTVQAFLQSDEAVLLGTTTELTPIHTIKLSDELGDLGEDTRFT